jgi:hypothetical protein
MTMNNSSVSANGRAPRRRAVSNTAYARAVRFFTNGGYKLKGARVEARRWLAAKARMAALAPELGVTWENEETPWEDLAGDLETDRPALWVSAVVRSTPKDEGYVRGKSVCLAQLGGIGLNAWTDGYVREVETDLLNEACDAIEAERARIAAIVPCPTCGRQ